VAATPRRLGFGAHAGAYERARPLWPAEAARWLSPGAPRLVVELGAGTGKLTRALAAAGRRVVAVEPDERMLAVLRGLELDGVSAVHGSGEAIPLDDGEADAVVAGSSLHWFELDAALAEAHRVLRPTGTLGFGWNHRDWLHPAMARVVTAIEEARVGHVGWRTRDWPAAVTGGGLFHSVEAARFPHVLDLPREGLADHLLSYSGIAALPATDRAALRERVERIVDGESSLRRGTRLALPFVVDAYRVVAVA
jgi:SAM-dependent methyltransferase